LSELSSPETLLLEMSIV